MADLIHPDDLDIALTATSGMKIVDIGPPIELRIRTGNGTWCHVEAVARNLYDHPEVRGLLVSVRDITRRRWRDMAVNSGSRSEILLQYAAGLLALVGHDGRLRMLSDGWGRMLGRYWEDAVGTLFVDSVDPLDRSRVLAALSSSSVGATHLEARLLHCDGHSIPYHLALVNMLDDPVVQGHVVTAHDISDLTAMRTQLEHLAAHDSLTDLPNRAWLLNQVAATLVAAGPCTEVVALFIDLDDFKSVNDSLGHQAGDEVLVQLAQRLTAGNSRSDMVARLGGDEFVVVAIENSDAVWKNRLIDHYEELVARPFRLGTVTIHTSASIGLASAIPGDTPETLFSRADREMYRAKTGRKGPGA